MFSRKLEIKDDRKENGCVIIRFPPFLKRMLGNARKFKASGWAFASGHMLCLDPVGWRNSALVLYFNQTNTI